MNKYYNSIEWGIQEKDTEDIRKKGLDFLEDIQCSTIKSYVFPIRALIDNKKIIEEILKKESKVFIICEPKSPKYPRVGQMNITNIEQINDVLSKIPEDRYDKYKLSIMQQIESIIGSFTGTAMSDGKGKILMEFLKDTVNSRDLTSIGADPKNLERCFFF